MNGDDKQIAQAFTNTGYAPGTYQSVLSLDTTSDPDAEDPVVWAPATYNVAFTVCQGGCGSKHPHSMILDQKSTSFDIVAPAVAPVVEAVDVNLDLCPTCMNLAGQGLNILLQEIMNVGVVGSCSKLCSYIDNKAGSTVCNLACDVVGFKGFVALIKKADLDVFYFCEEVKMCPAGGDDAAGSITDVGAQPESGPAGTTFQIGVQFEITVATGVGEIIVQLEGDDKSISQAFTNTGYAPGTYQSVLSLDTTSDPDAEDPVVWAPATYNVAFTVCQGECGSKHPHSIVLDQKTTSFEIVAETKKAVFTMSEPVLMTFE